MVAALTAVLAAQPGFEPPNANEVFQWPCIVHFSLGGLNLCINRVVLLEFLATAVVAAIFIVAFRRPRIVPRGTQNALESLYDFVGRDIIESVIGRKGIMWAPYVTILFVFAFVLSLLEVVPGLQFPVSSRMAVPAMLAFASWLVYNYAGIRQKGLFGYLRSIAFPPGVPAFAYIIMTPIELATALVIRPFTLAIRLFANFFAGHLLLVVVFVGTAYLVANPITIGFGIVAVIASVLLVGLEVFIALVQAYVFSLLTAVYITLSVSEEH